MRPVPATLTRVLAFLKVGYSEACCVACTARPGVTPGHKGCRVQEIASRGRRPERICGAAPTSAGTSDGRLRQEAGEILLRRRGALTRLRRGPRLCQIAILAVADSDSDGQTVAEVGRGSLCRGRRAT